MIPRYLRAAGDVGGGASGTSLADTAASWFNADDFLSGLRRINIFCGGFGSGKTEVAVNFSLRMREMGRRVAIADLDIVNLYFRSREVREQLRGRGIEMIVPGGALANADLPIIVPEVRGALEDRGPETEDRDGRAGTGRVTVLDLGGDPAGAKVMASIAEGMRPEDYSGLFVLNARRPFTATVEAAKRMLDGISSAARIGVDRIVVNSHLIDETTPAIIEEGIALGEKLSRATGAAIAFVTVQRELLGRFDAAGCRYPVMVLERLMLKPWEPAHDTDGANSSNWLGKYRIDT